VAPESLIAAIDVGGTQMKGGLVNRTASLVFSSREPTPAQAGPDAVLKAICAFATALIDQAHNRGEGVRAVSVAVPGIVDEARGVVVSAVNLGWRHLPLRELLEARLNLPVVFGHDVRSGGLAEARLGAARGVNDALFVPLGTGIAAAIFAGGRLVSGAGYAGELGHLPVDPAGQPCQCGGRGCLETVSSASAIARRYAQRSGRPVGDAAEVARRMAGGDLDAGAVWSEAVEALASALVVCSTLLAPEVIVIGGGLVQAGEVLLGPLRTALQAGLTVQRRPRLMCAALGDNAGCLGAGLRALEVMA
jgi:glucokinase